MDSIGLNFQEASKDEVISTIFQLKKLELYHLILNFYFSYILKGFPPPCINM